MTSLSAAIIAVVLAGAWLILLGAFTVRLAADWREPVLAAPVLIIESDDWGPGPPADAIRLQRLAAELQELRDCHGHVPVVTLGVVLAVPGEAETGVDSGVLSYVPHTLDEAEFVPLRKAMLVGRDVGVFALQLHGMEHFWPPALLNAAQKDLAARSFLAGARGEPRHESLPPHLQTRWIDASRLPSVALDRAAIERAVAAEVACFESVFGGPPRVVVPVTFTWTTDVEAAWAGHGIRVVVTPGTRNVARDERGRLVGDGSILRNGDVSAAGLVYAVRDIYFEPALGHSAQQALVEILDHHRLGRPALVEMHRFNFIGDDAQAKASIAELRRLLQGALAAVPQLRFMSTETLAEGLRARDPALLDLRPAARVRAFIRRATRQHRLRKLAWISGLALVAVAVLAVASALLARSGNERGTRT